MLACPAGGISSASASILSVVVNTSEEAAGGLVMSWVENPACYAAERIVDTAYLRQKLTGGGIPRPTLRGLEPGAITTLTV